MAVHKFGVIGAGATYVGVFFVDDNVDGDVVFFAMLANDLPFVNGVAWFDKEDATVIQAVKRVGGDLSCFHGNHDAEWAAWYVAFHGLVAV